MTGAILPAEQETRAQLWLEEYGGFHKGFRRQVFDLTTHRRDTALYPYDAGQFGSGANMAFRTDVLRAMGGFAVDLGAGTPAHGGEDIDVLRSRSEPAFRSGTRRREPPRKEQKDELIYVSPCRDDPSAREYAGELWRLELAPGLIG